MTQINKKLLKSLDVNRIQDLKFEDLQFDINR